jgi:ribonuclease HII
VALYSAAPAMQNRGMAHFRIERRYLREGRWPIAGIDEAGRGPLAGPVAVAAVILDPETLPRGLDDSKALSEETREYLFDEIMKKALAVSVALASAREIDAINIRQATLNAMSRAARALSLAPVHVLVDGKDVPKDLPCAGEAIVKGDATSFSIAAASIIAKVTRDRLMKRLAARYPAYGFESHAGYGTKAHLAAIEAHGPCPYHRFSFKPFKPDLPQKAYKAAPEADLFGQIDP